MKYEKYALSIALASSFLSAVADRFGFWGSAGEPGVVWGNYNSFLEYTRYLNSWAPKPFIQFLGGTATSLEVIIALGLLIGFQRRYMALASGSLLGLFAISMIITDGFKGPLDYSVFSAMSASFLLAKLELISLKEG